MADSPQRTRLLVVGSIALDRLERGRSIVRRLGGAVTYSGLTALRLGCSVDAWTAMPAASAAVARRLLTPINLHVSPSAEPTRFVNREIPGHEREQLCPSQADRLRWEARVFPADARWDWVHLGPLHAEDLDAAVTSPLRQHCRVLSLDLQGYTRRIAADGSVAAEVVADMARRLEAVDWVKASEAEWELVAAALGLGADDACARFGWRGLLVTGGAAGGVAHVGGEAISWDAHKVDEVALETGAGDVFLASFVARMIERGDLEAAQPLSGTCRDALDHAADVAARHVAGRWLDLATLALTD
jgi:sugar/nucleoside kinase (ribokinase family)